MKHNLNEELMKEIYSLRMLVFIETSPQSNQYNQVLLDPKTFKKVSFAISAAAKMSDEIQITPVPCSVEVYTLPDLQQIHHEPHG